ncbi:MAG: sulfocyanin-like copper-binding protein [Actinomycetota bacterium]|nr:sulfocyanin-like copper-binding protein [Actinomycetota bacterium]
MNAYPVSGLLPGKWDNMRTSGRTFALGAATAVLLSGGALLAEHWGRQTASQIHMSLSAQGNSHSNGYMMGGSNAPGWERGTPLQGSMMGGSNAPGLIMGRLYANAPGPRISTSAAMALAKAVPEGAKISPAHRTVTFSSTHVHLTVVATMMAGTDGFELAGMTNPSIVVPQNSKVEVTFVNADNDMAHGLAVVPQGAGDVGMPMMTAGPVFDGASVWFLGDATASGAPEQTLTFSADRAGTYQYICPVPGHALAGMQGELIVS